MGLLVRIIRRLASERDRRLLDASPGGLDLLRVTARTALRHIGWYLGLLGAIGAYAFVSGMDVYHRTEMPAFCGSCHEMGTNLRSWEVSTHGEVRCVDCHARPGPSGWAAAKLGGVRQLLVHLSSSSIEDIRMGDEDLRIVSENCLRCHPGAARLDERAGIAISHREHMEKGVRCVDCHSRRFAHPDAGAASASAEHTESPASLSSHADCFGCHDGNHAVGGTTVFDAREESSCERCHPDALAVYDHGGEPWEEEDRRCLACHDPRVDSHFSLRGAGEIELCARCHEALGERHASTHEPFREERCHECHRVMSPLHLFGNGPLPTASFCLACHEDTGLRLSDGSAASGARFVSGNKDLHRKHAKYLDEDPAWCGTCHAGHGSQAGRSLIRLRDDAGELDASARFEAQEEGGSCTGACHADPAEYEWASAPASPPAGVGKTP